MTIQKLLHEQYFPLALFMMMVVKMKIMAVFTLETGYPLDNSRQTDNTSKFENETVLILDG